MVWLSNGMYAFGWSLRYCWHSSILISFIEIIMSSCRHGPAVPAFRDLNIQAKKVSNGAHSTTSLSGCKPQAEPIIRISGHMLEMVLEPHIYLWSREWNLAQKLVLIYVYGSDSRTLVKQQVIFLARVQHSCSRHQHIELVNKNNILFTFSVSSSVQCGWSTWA